MFWDNYLELCNSVNKSPSGVAVEIGLSDAAATGWKRGARPRQTVLMKIAQYFGVSVEYLLREKETPRSEAGASTPERRELHEIIEELSDAKVNLLLEKARELKLF